MVENNGKIYITISNEKATNNALNSNSTKSKETSQENEKNNILTHYVNDFLLNKSKQVVMYGIGNIGNFTGNYQRQAEINETISIGGKLFSIGMATAKYGIAGLITSTLGTALSEGMQEYSRYIDIKKQNKNIEQLRDLSGLNSLTNGSR